MGKEKEGFSQYQEDCITVSLDLVKKGGAGTEAIIQTHVFGFDISIINENGTIKAYVGRI